MPKPVALNFANTRKATKEAPEKTERPDRNGKRLVATHLPQAAYTDLRILAARLDTTQADLIEEALTDLMHKYKDKL